MDFQSDPYSFTCFTNWPLGGPIYNYFLAPIATFQISPQNLKVICEEGPGSGAICKSYLELYSGFNIRIPPNLVDRKIKGHAQAPFVRGTEGATTARVPRTP